MKRYFFEYYCIPCGDYLPPVTVMMMMVMVAVIKEKQ